MFEWAVIMEWLEFAARWTHAITAIAWIGSSFYFIALDLGLTKRAHHEEGVQGEEWQVHGGGFYHIQKYNIAPATMPDHLTWFKWESYSTWLSGFVLLCLVYYLGADLYLIDSNIADISAPLAIAISLGSIGFGWLAYDFLCKSKLAATPSALMVLLFALLTVMAWAYTQVFTGRAALLHLGAFTATIMTCNVFLIIMPNQRIVVADLKAGRTPDAKYGKVAKLRSTHNNYLTLPVIFFMLSNHYPLAFATQYNWIIASLVFLMGVTIRHYFNTKHSRKGDPIWTWLATAILFVIIMALSTAPMWSQTDEKAASTKTSATQQHFIEVSQFKAARDVVLSRCSMCHAKEPVWEGILWAPKGILLETDQQISAQARAIYMQSGLSHAMPPANITGISQDERHTLVAWYRQAMASR